MSDPSFNYPGSPYNKAIGTLIDISVNNLYGTPLKYTLYPPNTLPISLTFDASNGSIKGTPTYSDVLPLTTFEVDASYATTVEQTTFALSINFIPNFFYPYTPYSIKLGKTISNIPPYYPMPLGITPYYYVSNLPGITYKDITDVSNLSSIGLSLNTSTGVIFGTATNVTLETTITIQANNDGIIFDTFLNISVIAEPIIYYPQSNYSLTQGVPVSISPNIEPQAVTYSITNCTGVLPLGLIFNKETGEISGTPTLLTTLRQYNITATNSVGSDTFTLTLAVVKEFLAPPAASDAFSGGMSLTDPTFSMRRKAEIFKYKKNGANISKNQQFALIAKGNGQTAKRSWGNQNTISSNPNISGLPQQGTTILCSSPAVVCSPTSSCDVPGPIMNLCYDPTVPLVGYVQPNQKKVNIGFKWPERAWTIGDMGFPVGKAGRN
jgi:hypothetical protein